MVVSVQGRVVGDSHLTGCAESATPLPAQLAPSGGALLPPLTPLPVHRSFADAKWNCARLGSLVTPNRISLANSECVCRCELKVRSCLVLVGSIRASRYPGRGLEGDQCGDTFCGETMSCSPASTGSKVVDQVPGDTPPRCPALLFVITREYPR